MPVIVQRYESMQYTGTNGPEVGDWLGNAEFAGVTEDGSLQLTVNSDGTIFTTRIPQGWWVLRYDGRHEGTVSPEDYPRRYYEIPGT
ncbi:hypothetical protein [Streptomyces sp. NPDC058620]|uniref:hypothetical protein n=1 Tax=Streptomyces sp. NPDC058620 TaxID=3346560 RepID=UPI0036608762